jgi:hypothetical protein
VLECGEGQRNNQEYFGALKKQLEQNGGAGYSALLFYLQNLDVTGFNVRNPPHTDALREQMAESTVGGMDILREMLSCGQIPGSVQRDGGININLNQVLGWAIKKRSEWSRVKYHALRDMLGAKGLGFEPMRQVIHDGKQGVLPTKRLRVWRLPDLTACRQKFFERFGFKDDWDDDATEWESTGAVSEEWVGAD